MDNKEIERKFRLEKQVKFEKWIERNEISQYYTEITTNKEVRYRQKGNKYFCTIKEGEGMSRTEIEKQITNKEFEKFQKDKVGRMIQKVRKEIIWNGWTLEIDEYIQPDDMTMILEIEFGSEKEAMGLDIAQLEEFIGCKLTEVTNDKSYKNKNIALNM
jgi:adenylate cyclase